MSSIPRKRPASVGSGIPAGHDIRYAFIGEAVGTYILVLFGTGSVAAGSCHGGTDGPMAGCRRMGWRGSKGSSIPRVSAALAIYATYILVRQRVWRSPESSDKPGIRNLQALGVLGSNAHAVLDGTTPGSDSGRHISTGNLRAVHRAIRVGQRHCQRRRA